MSCRPGDASYRRDISSTLTLRWSTAADRAGCALLACLAPGLQQGHENEFAVRYFEAYTSDNFHAGSSTNWALCVDRFPRPNPPRRSLSINTQMAYESEYLTSLRKQVQDAPEKIVALIYFLRAEFSFEKGAARVGAGKVQIVACLPSYRRKEGTVNVMKGLFEMVHDRAYLKDCSLTISTGIPGYYRTHGYEYALRLGPGLVTPTEVIHTAARLIPPDAPYTLRPATQRDIPSLEKLASAARSTSSIYYSVSDNAFRLQLAWLLGYRSPPFDESPVYDAAPFYVLEKTSEGKQPVIIAAAGLQNRPDPESPAPSVTVHPLLWNGQESGPEVVSVLVAKLYLTLNDDLNGEGSDSRIAKINWIVAEGHPLRKWLLARQVANIQPESSLYDSHGNWWINILSLPLFFKLLTPALNARLAGASQELGRHYSGELHISTWSTNTQGVLIKIVRGEVAAIEGTTLSTEEMHAATFGQGGPNICLPRGALTQLLMGYKSWKELKAIFPDVIINPSVVPAVEALFPKLTLGSCLYF